MKAYVGLRAFGKGLRNDPIACVNSQYDKGKWGRGRGVFSLPVRGKATD